MTTVTSCYICSDDKNYSNIYLPDGEIVSIGRTPDTKIIDTKCSRKQVNLCACYAENYVTIQQIGSNVCGLNGAKTVRGQKYIGKHGDVLEVLYGKLRYKIEFKPAPTEKNIEKINGKKRACMESDSEDEQDNNSGKTKKARKEFFDESKPTTSKVDNNDEENKDKSIAELMMDVSMEKIEGGTWEDVDKQTLMIYTASGVEARSKIAAYDMDNTLITTQSGKVFPTDHNDWKILMPEVPGKLKKLHADGYKIVIFTNQAGLGMGKSTPNDFKQKIERIIKRLSVPIQVFIATSRDSYRKPLTGMWDRLVNHNNDGVFIEKSESFFVGDAAGRPKDWAPKKKKDHSLADRLLAMNIGIKFQTPEEHFLGHRPSKFDMPAFDPKKLSSNSDICDPPSAELTAKKQEVVIMVGGPGSGKSHVATTHLKDYQHVNRDKLGSWQKCVAAMEKALSEGKSVVIDNTNPDVISRQRFINVAKEKNIPVRCFLMTTSPDHAKHNNRFRELTDSSHTVVKDVIIHTYVDTHSTLVWRCTRFIKILLLLCLRLIYAVTLNNNIIPYRKTFVTPTINEGFNEIVKINFTPRFQSDKHRQLYQMYLLEK